MSAVLMGTVLVGGCAGSRDEKVAEVPSVSEAPVTTSPVVVATTTSSAVQSDEQAIIAAVHGYWEVILKASNPPDPNYPGLTDYMTGDAQERALAVINKRRQVGQAVRLPENAQYRHDPIVQSIDGDTAITSDCAVDDSILFDYPTGRVLNDAVGTTLWTATLARVGGRWRVSRVTQNGFWDGATRCDG